MSRYLLVCLSVLASLGCSSIDGDQEVESSESNQTIDPKGLGELGAVTIELPPSFQADVPSLRARFVITFNGTELLPGVMTKVIPTKTNGHWGVLRVDLVGRDDNHEVVLSRMEDFHTLAPGEARTIKLSLLKLWWSGHPTTGGEVDAAMPGASSRPVLKRVWGGNPVVQWKTAPLPQNTTDPYFNSDYFFFGKNDIALPVPPGPFTYALGALPPIAFDVPEFQQVDVNADYHRFTGSLEVKFPDREGFRDGAESAVLLNCGDTSAKATYAKPAARILMDKSAASCSATLYLSRQTVAVPVELRAGSTSTMELRRLNIRNVELTNEGGARVSGTFEVRPAGASPADPPLVEAPTETGVNLLPGTYDVRVKYETAGRTKENLYTVTL